MSYNIILYSIVSFAITFAVLPLLIKQGLKNNVFGYDINKSSRPKVFHIGGIAVIAGFFIAGMLGIGITFFSLDGLNIDITLSIAIMLTALSLAFLGLVDDILDIPQWVKALLPMIATIPLIALRAVGNTAIFIPLIGEVDFGVFYLFFIIPFAVSGAANLSNIFAGINGLEASLSFIMYLTTLFFGILLGKPHMAFFSAIMLGSLIAFLFYNKYPAKTFPGDVATLVFGGVLASLAIVDNLESILPFLFFPHFIDLLIKLKNRLPSKGWNFEEKDGFLLPPKKPVSLLQYTVKYLGKMKERDLVYFFSFIEIIFALLSILFIVYL